MNRCASILLAAGSSSRLGRPKQLLRVHGESLLRRTARFAGEAGCSPNIVVLGAYSEELRHELDGLAVEIVINSDWHTGMGSSLRTAMDWLLLQSSVPSAVLLLVCDQPNVSAELVQSLISKHADENSIVASRYREDDSDYVRSWILGVPAVFGAAFFTELALIQGDQGARRILSQHADKTSHIDFQEGSFDVDTPADELSLSHPQLF